MVKPGGRQYTQEHDKVLIEAIASGIEPLEFHREMEKKMRPDFGTYAPEALFNSVAKQQRDQASCN